MIQRAQLALALLVAAACATGCEPPTVTVTDSQVPVTDTMVGTGREAKNGDLVTVHYKATSTEGKKMLEHRDFRFELGAGTVIQGIDEGVLGMREGGRRRVHCRPRKHWGRKGYGEAIPPNTTLIFELTLVSVDDL